MKSKKGFTIIELLTAIAVVALLLSLLLPSLQKVRDMAREAKQRVQFSVIDQALLAWRNEHGEYPQSFFYFSATPGNCFCGTQKLAEALFGLDLLGFHPNSNFWPDGLDGDELLYQETQDPISSQVRESRYLELESANAYRLECRPGATDGLVTDSGMFYGRSYVLCDEFKRIPITVGTENEKAGMPILYYRADPSKRTIAGGRPENRIYNENDNAEFVEFLGNYFKQDHPLVTNFYSFIEDPKAKQLSGVPWPYKPDSYILISAGLDGIYGTADDITNFR